ncbi:MAG TPA: hypothetical protein PK843_08075 [bacterium]|nr:hypothetical protein [bacterium]HPN34455.1 hypothetical protein [bacterium]
MEFTAICWNFATTAALVAPVDLQAVAGQTPLKESGAGKPSSFPAF